MKGLTLSEGILGWGMCTGAANVGCACGGAPGGICAALVGTLAGWGRRSRFDVLTPLWRALRLATKQRLFARHMSEGPQQLLCWAVGLQGESPSATTPPGYQQVGMVIAQRCVV